MIYKMLVWSVIFTLLLLTGSCELFDGEDPADEPNAPSDTLTSAGTDEDPADQPNPPSDEQKVIGNFSVTLDTGLLVPASMIGGIKDGPTPSTLVWEETASSGQCRLLTPRNPFCEPRCGGAALCVEDGQCQSYPDNISAGTVKVDGLKTSTGKTSFSVPFRVTSYQLIDIILAYPPFAEGDIVTFTASGHSSVPPFTLTARGVGILEVLNDSIVLADGQPINLTWTPPAQADIATISVLVNVNNHGSVTGKIECSDILDDGSFEVPASLIDQLKALGMSGFPTIDITRKSVGTNSSVDVDLVIESNVTLSPIIPGLISCTQPEEGEEDECPPGLTCQVDLQCK